MRVLRTTASMVGAALFAYVLGITIVDTQHRLALVVASTIGVLLGVLVGYSLREETNSRRQPQQTPDNH
jgi:uncharacterized protein YebE (UPF0316 family)